MIEDIITYNSLDMNKQADRPCTSAPFYWFRILSVDGLWDSDVRFESHNLPRQNFVSSGDSYLGGKTLVIAGRVEARTIANLRTGQLALMTAFDLGEHDLEFMLGASPYKITCRRNQRIDMPEVQGDNGTPLIKRPFTIQLFADDGTITANP